MLKRDFYVYSDKNVYVPAHLNFGKFIFDRIRLQKDEIALENCETGEKSTYLELAQNAVNLSTSLSRLGIGRGDTIGVGSEKRNEFLVTLLAVVFTGATYTPFDIDNGRVAINYKIKLTKPKYLICSKLFWDMYGNKLDVNDVKRIFSFDYADTDSVISLKSLITDDIDVSKFEPAPVQGQTDTALILYSSGTTGMPKAVELTHLNCIINSTFEEYMKLNTALTYGEWYHSYDTFITYKFISAGRKIVYANDLTLEVFLKSIEDHQVDIAFIVPSIIERLSKANEIQFYNLDSLRILYTRGAPLHSKISENVIKRLPKLEGVLQGYGMTESSEIASEIWGTKGSRPGSVGKPSPGNVFKVIDIQTREVLGPYQHGEVHLRSPTLMKGYVGIDPSAYLDEEGFFKTGDLGYYDEHGYFFITDRIKDVICYDGYKITPLEIETVILLHPGVREAAVIGKPVPIYGEEPVAFVVRIPGISVTEEELVDHVAAEVSPFMQLRGGVKFIEELPRNPRGKVLRRQLREMLHKKL